MNKNKILSLAVVAFLSIPSLLMAASLGQVKTYSHLNEKLNAVIPVLSVLNKKSLTISIASFAESKKRGVQLSKAASKINLSLYEKNGRVYIKATSKQKIRESYLNFIIKLKVGNSGSISRKYAIFLDPIAKNKKGKKQVTSVKKPIKSVKKIPAKKVTDFNKKKTKTPLKGVLKIVNKKGSTYGPIKKGDTLWLIASKLRPSKSIYIGHMVTAIKQSNPKIQGSLEIGTTINIPTIKGYENKTVISKNNKQKSKIKKADEKNQSTVKNNEGLDTIPAKKTAKELELEKLASEKLEKERLEAAANLKRRQEIAKKEADRKKRIAQEKIRQVEKAKKEKAKKEKAKKEAKIALQKKAKEKRIALELKVAKENAAALRLKNEQRRKMYMYGAGGVAALLLGGLFFYNKKRKAGGAYIQEDIVLMDDNDIDLLSANNSISEADLNIEQEHNNIKEDTLASKETSLNEENNNISDELKFNDELDFEDDGLDLDISTNDEMDFQYNNLNLDAPTSNNIDFDDDNLGLDISDNDKLKKTLDNHSKGSEINLDKVDLETSTSEINTTSDFDFSLSNTDDSALPDLNKVNDFNISSSEDEDMGNIITRLTTDNTTDLDSEASNISLEDIEEDENFLSLGNMTKEEINLEKTATHVNDVSSKLKSYVEETKASTSKRRATKVIPSMEINLARGFKSVGNLDGAKAALSKAIEFGNAQEVSEAKKLFEELI